MLAVAFGFLIPAAGTVLAATTPTIITTVVTGTNAAVGSAPIGTALQANVAVSSNTSSSTPTGTVDITLYATTNCTGNSSTQAAVPLSLLGVAQSATTTLGATGLSYMAHYNGDLNNLAASGSCQGVTATAASPTLTTTLSSTAVLAGASVHDSAVLSGATAEATGTVAYTIYADSACTLNATSAGTKTVAAHLVPDSDSMQFSSAGTFYWQAAYSGDQYDLATSSPCQSEILTVSPTTTPPTTGHIVIDEVTNPAADPTSFSFTTSGTGYANFSLTDQAAPNDQTLSPGTYAVSQTVPGGWSLTAAVCMTNNATSTAYTPGSNLALNAGDTIRCTFTDTKQGTTTATGTISGEVFNDQNGNGAIDAGEPGLSGWKVRLYGTEHVRAWFTWFGFHWPYWADRGYVATATTDANGAYSFGSLPAGTYYLREMRKGGWFETTPPPGAVTLSAGASVTNINFGNEARVVKPPRPPKPPKPPKIDRGEGGGDHDGQGNTSTTSVSVSGSLQGNSNSDESGIFTAGSTTINGGEGHDWSGWNARFQNMQKELQNLQNTSNNIFGNFFGRGRGNRGNGRGD